MTPSELHSINAQGIFADTRTFNYKMAERITPLGTALVRDISKGMFQTSPRKIGGERFKLTSYEDSDVMTLEVDDWAVHRVKNVTDCLYDERLNYPLEERHDPAVLHPELVPFYVEWMHEYHHRRAPRDRSLEATLLESKVWGRGMLHEARVLMGSCTRGCQYRGEVMQKTEEKPPLVELPRQ